MKKVNWKCTHNSGSWLMLTGTVYIYNVISWYEIDTQSDRLWYHESRGKSSCWWEINRIDVWRKEKGRNSAISKLLAWWCIAHTFWTCRCLNKATHRHANYREKHVSISFNAMDVTFIATSQKMKYKTFLSSIRQQCAVSSGNTMSDLQGKKVKWM